MSLSLGSLKIGTEDIRVRINQLQEEVHHLQSTAYESSTVDRMMIHGKACGW
jgi:hypothetical protein